MPIKAKHNGSYKDITDLMNVDESIDYVLAKTSSSYKRVYTATRSIEDTPPTTFKSIKPGANLTDYRIYGQTVDGESVGDRTGNLFDENATSTVNGYVDGAYINYLGATISESAYATSEYILIPEGTTTISVKVPIVLISPAICFYGNDKTYISGAKYNGRYVVTESIPIGAKYLRFTIVKQYAHTTMVYEGSTLLPYEPYGYRVPVTVTNDNNSQTTNLYLPEPLRMVGTEADYIDYTEQKQHRLRKNLLPTITATNSKNGILLRSESDGTVIINGTATAVTFFSLRYNISYPFNTILSGCPQGGSINGYCLRAMDGTSIVGIDYGNGLLIPANTDVDLEIRIAYGVECNNIEFKPMFRRADIEDDTYEPYIENTEVDVTLPTLPTLPGTNVLSVGSEVQPSKIDITGHIKTISGGS